MYQVNDLSKYGVALVVQYWLKTHNAVNSLSLKSAVSPGVIKDLITHISVKNGKQAETHWLQTVKSIEGLLTTLAQANVKTEVRNTL